MYDPLGKMTRWGVCVGDLRGSFLGDFQPTRKSFDGVKPTGRKLLPFMILKEIVLVLLIGDFLW